MRYSCAKCEDYDICEPCFFQGDDEEEEGSGKHPHPLKPIKLPPKPTIAFDHTISQKIHIFVGNFACALPGSQTLKQHNISAVLSLIELPNPNSAMAPLAAVLTSSSHVVNGVVYHHLNVADVANPDLLGAQGPIDMFLEATAFITEAVRRERSVLIHCELGQRRYASPSEEPLLTLGSRLYRSPLVFLAWLVTQNVTVQGAISSFAKGHLGQEGQRWKDRFVSTRPKWIERLKEWSSSWTARLPQWQSKHSETMSAWFAEGSQTQAVPAAALRAPSHKTHGAGQAQVTEKAKPPQVKKRSRVVDEDDDVDAVSPVVSVPKKPKVEPEPATQALPSTPLAPKSTMQPKTAPAKQGSITSFFNKAK